MNEFKNLKACIDRLQSEGCGARFAIRIGTPERFQDLFFGNGVNADTNFDMASVTKIFCTTVLTLQAFDEGKLSPETFVSDFFPVPEDKKTLTVKHLLTHSMGFGHKPLNRPEVNYDNVASYILNIPCEFAPGTEVEYCCPAFILLGKILEKIYGKRLDALFKEKVAEPLKLQRTAFGSDGENTVNSNETEEERGLVNDYNCRHLGGIAGNAGLYSNLNDLTCYVKMLLSAGAPLLRPETLMMARKNYTSGLSEDRGLGFLYVTDRYSQTGNLFKEGCFGHCGHTGQSLFMDPDSGFFVIVLSDMTVSVKGEYERVIRARELIHNAIQKDLEKSRIN